MKISKLLLPALLFLFSHISFGQNWDIDLLRNINVNRNENLDPFFTGLSKSVLPVSIAYPASFLSIGLLKRDTAIFLQGVTATLAIGFTGLVSYGLKHAVDRPRPYVIYPDIQNPEPAPDPWSFPSGHTSLAFATATGLSLAYPRWYVIAPAYLWAGLVGYSRMHLGLHYPTDVLAGAVIGAGGAWLSYKANRWVVRKYHL